MLLTWLGSALLAPAYALSLDQALDLAVREAPSLAAQAAERQAARSAAVPAGELPDPRLALGLQNLPIEGDSAWDLNAERMTMQRIGLMQEVPSRAKRAARVDLAQAQVGLADARMAVELLAVRQQAAEAWLMTRAVEEKLDVFKALYAENRLLSRAVDARLASGEGLTTDSIGPRQEAALLADREDELQRQHAQARAQLRRWIGESAAQPLSGGWPQWPVDAEQYRASLQRHPQLQVFDPLTRQAQAQLQSAIAEKKPDWSWGVDYLRRDSAFGDMVNLSVTFDLPVFTASRQDPAIEAERARLQRVDAQREAVERRYQSDLSEALAEYQRLESTLARSQRTLVPLAEQKVELAMADYRSGRGSLAGVISGREQLIDARLRHIDLARDRSLSNARLYFAFGADRP
tara:strand:+ start:957 stop:2174 length:1218 start_codon:yes stop_codon:yes gene_type:complete